MSSDLSSAPPPQYSSATPRPRTTYIPPNRPTPKINVLLLGSPGIGKSTFISKVPHVRDGQLQAPPAQSPQSSTNASVSPNNASTSSLPPPYTVSSITSTSGPLHSPKSSTQPTTIPNPSTFNVSLFARPYLINLHRSTSSLFIDPFPSKIDALVLCYAIDDRVSLLNAQRYWRRVFTERYEVELGTVVPVMLVGFKRDLRSLAKTKRSGDEEVGGEGKGDDESEEYDCVMPEEGLQAAREMKCDRYAECSAVTGELMFEVLEDVTRMAAGTTTTGGGFSEASCAVM